MRTLSLYLFEPFLLRKSPQLLRVRPIYYRFHYFFSTLSSKRISLWHFLGYLKIIITVSTNTLIKLNKPSNISETKKKSHWSHSEEIKKYKNQKVELGNPLTTARWLHFDFRGGSFIASTLLPIWSKTPEYGTSSFIFMDWKLP